MPTSKRQCVGHQRTKGIGVDTGFTRPFPAEIDSDSDIEGMADGNLELLLVGLDPDGGFGLLARPGYGDVPGSINEAQATGQVMPVGSVRAVRVMEIDPFDERREYDPVGDRDRIFDGGGDAAFVVSAGGPLS